MERPRDQFLGAAWEMKDLFKLIKDSRTQDSITNFLSSKSIEWKFIPQRAPHFGGLWEAAVKSTKRHLKRIVGNVKLTFEELTTVLAQVEACLNSRPLIHYQTTTTGLKHSLQVTFSLVDHCRRSLMTPSLTSTISPHFVTGSYAKHWSLTFGDDGLVNT